MELHGRLQPHVLLARGLEGTVYGGVDRKWGRQNRAGMCTTTSSSVSLDDYYSSVGCPIPDTTTIPNPHATWLNLGRLSDILLPCPPQSLLCHVFS